MADEPITTAPADEQGAPEAPSPPLVRDGDLVAIRDPDGSVSMVRSSDLSAALDEGAVPATETEWQRAKLGTSGKVAAAAVGVGQGLSFGYAAPALIHGAEALGADDYADEVRRGMKIAREAAPDEYLGGEVAGAVAPLLLGAPPGEAASITGESALARAGQRALKAAPRAFAEGAAIGVGQQATEDAIENKDFAASAYGTAAFKGGLVGLLLGSGAAAGLGHLGDRLGAPVLGRGEQAVEDAALEGEGVAARQPGAVTIDPDAGLYERAGKTEKPFVFGGKNHSVSIDSAVENEFASAQGGPSVVDMARSVSLDPEAINAAAYDTESPLQQRLFAASEPAATSPEARDWWLSGKGLPPGPEEPVEPFVIGKLARARGEEAADATAPVFMRKPSAVTPGMDVPTETAPFEFRLGIDPNAGLGAETSEANALGISGYRPGINPDAGLEDALVGERNAFRVSRSKNAPRSVSLGDVEQTDPFASRSGIRIAAPSPEAVQEEAAKAGQLGAKEWLEAQANRQAFNATGAKVGDIRRLGSSVEEQQAEMQRLGERLRNETVAGKPLIEPTTSQAEIARRVTDRANEVGKELGTLRSRLNEAAARPSMDSIVQRFESEVAGPIESMPLGEREVTAARDYLEDMVAKGGDAPDFDKLFAYRRRLDDMLRKQYSAPAGMPVPPGKEALMGLRNIIEDEFTSAGERASQEIGSEFASKYRLTKDLYADLATLRDISRSEAERNAGANFVSLTDAVVASMGGPKAIAAVVANQVRRKYGNQIAAHLLTKASKLLAVEDAAVKLDASLNKATRRYVEGTGAKTVKAGIRAYKKVSADDVREIRDAVRTPEIVNERVARGLGDLREYAPNLATAATTAAARTASWLRDNLPKESPPTTLQLGLAKSRPLSDTELLKAGQMIEVAKDPSIVVDRLMEGRLSATHVAALKGTHPEVYARIQQYIQTHATELRKQLPVQEQVALSLLFGQPVTEAMLPENVRALQATFSQGSQAPKQDGSAGGLGRPVRGLDKPGGTRATALDRMEADS